MEKFGERIIHYVFITERSQIPGNMVLPPMCNTSLPIFSYLGRYPRSLDQFALGNHFFSTYFSFGLKMGYDFKVVYLENLYDESKKWCYFNENIIQLFFISIKPENVAQLYDFLLRNHYSNICYQCINMADDERLSSLPNFIFNHWDFLNFLWHKVFLYIPQNLLDSKDVFSVSIDAREFDRGSFFRPTQVNTFIIQSILENWGAPLLDDELSEKESIDAQLEEIDKAKTNKDEFLRQQIFVRQIEQFDSIILKLIYCSEAKIFRIQDNIFLPLIIVSPFNNPLINKLLEINETDSFDDKLQKRGYKVIMELEQDKNYTHSIKMNSDEYESLVEYIPFGLALFERRKTFLDNVGYLHASFTCSPYIRLPLIGKSIYDLLSSMSLVDGTMLVSEGNVCEIRNKISEIGKLISENIISAELQETIKNRDSQLVVITDMPFEWIMIDNIPLGFTHDICRIPETPNGGIMAQYMHNSFWDFEIPINILEKTLVVFGCTDEHFSLWQQLVVEMQQELHFEICICSNVDQFVEKIRSKSPLFLIIDSHGDADVDTNQSYIMLGEEKLTPAIIADNNITIPLIFLSACNTAPAYMAMNTVANAFFERGARSVTSSYLPLDVNVSSVAYIRLLRQLSKCAKEGYHKNWLSFISYILRTSFVMSPYIQAKLKGDIGMEETLKEEADKVSKSLIFSERRKIYQEIQEGFEANSKLYSADFIRPEYLFYSNLGRGDLVYFKSWKLMKEKKVMDIIK